MEAAVAQPRPLVICPLEDGEGEVYTCSTHKAVKSAMSIIESKYPDARYDMHLGTGYGIFGLITLPRRTVVTIVNKIISKTVDFGYVGTDRKDSYYNPTGTRVLNVTITVNVASWYGSDNPEQVLVSLSTFDPVKEEEE